VKLFLFSILILGLAMAASFARTPASEEQQTLYTSHPCETRWYAVSSDTDSVTVACYTPDETEEQSK
jgi:hypothetical protein